MLKLLVLFITFSSAFCFFNLLKKNTVGTQGSSIPEPITSRVNRVQDAIRGISPHDISRYRNDVFTCDLNRKHLDSSVINDGYCDCDDGSDEPGTSACSRGVFKCLNKGYKIIPITSSRVDDGICDCCDGSDEGVITASCPNTCNALADKERATLDRIAASYKKGAEVRNQYIETASVSYSNALNSKQFNEEEDAQLQSKLNAVQAVLEQELILEKHEQKAGLMNLNLNIDGHLSLNTIHTSQLSNLIHVLCMYYEINKNELIDYMEHVISSNGNIIKNPTLNEFDIRSKNEAEIDYSMYLSPMELNHCLELTRNNAVFKYICNFIKMTDEPQSVVDTKFTLIDLAKYVLKEMIYDKSAYVATQYAYIGILTGKGLSVSEEPPNEILFDPEVVLGYMKSHEEEVGGDISSNCLMEYPSETLLCNLANTLENLFKDGYNAKYVLKRHETQMVHNEIKQIEQKIKHNKERIMESSKYIDMYNKHSGFASFVSLNDMCMESEDGGKFIYTLCMLKEIKQKEVNGRGLVTLGSFESFEENKDGTISMHFDKGTHCHAHGARRADVVVSCGVDNKLKEPREPSTCFYTFELESPAACTQKYAELNGIA